MTGVAIRSAAIAAGLAACSGYHVEHKNDFSWNTKGDFKIACANEQSPGKRVKDSEVYSTNLKSAAEALCGGPYNLSDLNTRVKTGTNMPSEISVSIEFSCTPDPAVLKRAESFDTNAFCRDTI